MVLIILQSPISPDLEDGKLHELCQKTEMVNIILPMTLAEALLLSYGN